MSGHPTIPYNQPGGTFARDRLISGDAAEADCLHETAPPGGAGTLGLPDSEIPSAAGRGRNSAQKKTVNWTGAPLRRGDHAEHARVPCFGALIDSSLWRSSARDDGVWLR
jgi:hypothetical protein